MSKSQTTQPNELQALIIWAVNDSKVGDVRNYLSQGANPNLQNADGNTVLHLAAKQNNVEITKLLLKYGADPDIENKKGEKAAYYATYFNPQIVNNQIAKLLESMSTAISALFGTRRAMKQVDLMLEEHKTLEKITTLKHLSPYVLKAIIIRAAKNDTDNLVAVLTSLLENQKETSKLNFLQDSSVVSKICDGLKQVSAQKKADIIDKLQAINTKARTVNYEMLEQAKTSTPTSSSKFSSLWQGTIGATKKEISHVKEVIDKARKPGGGSSS